MKNERRRQARLRCFLWLLAALLIGQLAMPFSGVLRAGHQVFADTPETARFELDVSDDMIYYGDWFTRLMRFRYQDTGETERAYCMNPELYPPREGTHTATIYNYRNVPDHYRALWKALYYLEGGPGYPLVADVWDSVYHYDPAHPDAWSSARAQAYALSHMVVSDLSPVGSSGATGAGGTYLRLENAMIERIKTMPDPPKTFQIAVYVSGSDLQNLTGYCAPLSVTGTLRLTKRGTETALTEDNPAYTLAGAEYGVYLDAGCTSKAASFTTDKSGKTDELTLEEGTYYVREDKASRGYVPDKTVHQAVIEADETTEIVSEEVPQRAVLEWLLFKTDKESGKAVPKGSASLEGAVFEVRWYAGQYDSAEAAAKDGAKCRTWQFRTDGDGRIAYADPYKTDGDALFYDAHGTAVLPCGLLVVREVTAPAGYLTDQESRQIRISPVSGLTDPVIPADQIGQMPSVPEQVMRGGFRFNKLKEGSAEAVAMVPFRVTSETTGEQHILVTDANGIADTESVSHTRNCNANDDAVSADGIPDETALDPSAGVWFYGYGEGGEENGAPEDAKKALPYDTYLVEELPCSVNKGYRPAVFRVRIDRDKVVIDRGTVTDYKDITIIGTTAVCKETASHYAPQTGLVTITDTVRYEGAQPGEKYRMEGVLMDRETGEPVLADGEPVTVSKEYTALYRDGAFRMTFEVDAAELTGHTTVVYETLYRDDVSVAEHKDIDDEGQTVRFPSIATQAARTEDGLVIDHVTYSGLQAGETYTMTAHLMDPDSGEEIKDVEGSLVFTPETDSGTVDVPIDVTGAGSGFRVVFEQCTLEGELIASHEDASCKEQTVLLPEKPATPVPQKNHSVPRTGDPAGSAAWWCLLGAAVVLATAGFARRTAANGKE